MALIEEKILAGGGSVFKKEEIGLGEFFFRQCLNYRENILQVGQSVYTKI